jgi:hypothetical protein
VKSLDAACGVLMDESLRDHMNLPALQQLVDLLELVSDEGAAATQALGISVRRSAIACWQARASRLVLSRHHMSPGPPRGFLKIASMGDLEDEHRT